ncbi:MAG: acetate kinase [Tidjanibacter sp.]|nr:acetate kinase [Tidjanibacter sp.]
MVILVLNCGSSSIKYQVIEMTESDNTLLAKGLVERIGIENGVITHKPTGKEPVKMVCDIPDHTVGIDLIIKAITHPESGVIASLEELDAVGHRVVHGGEQFKESTLINEAVMEMVEGCVDLAPLHIPANLKGIYAINELLPGVPQVANFDTAFHQTMPAKAFLYGIPRRYYDEYRVRAYGFHGTSHRFVAEQAAKMVGLDFEKSKIVTCHIGNGGSVTAVMNGKSVDTSMGLTPVDGVIMGTRCGSIDAGVLNFIHTKEGKSMEEIWSLINKESGIYGLSGGLSSDMRDIRAAAEAGNQTVIDAEEAYFYRVKKYVGSYAAAMGGIDLLVFTGGVGENGPEMREYVCKGMEFMGIEFDSAANAGVKGQDKVLSAPTSRVKVVVIGTNEELVIATDTFNIVSKLKK